MSRKVTCSCCGIVAYPHSCPIKNRDRYKVNKDRVDNKIYQTKEWRKLREEVREDAKYMCLVSFYCCSKVVVASTAHHIEEVLKSDDKVYEIDNLIALNESMHREIHKVYKTNYKKDMQELQRKCNEMWREGNREIGLLSNEWDRIIRLVDSNY